MSDVYEIDATTGAVESRSMTAAEQAQRDADHAAAEQLKAEQEAKAELATQARRKIADASGLTPEEMAALGF